MIKIVKQLSNVFFAICCVIASISLASANSVYIGSERAKIDYDDILTSINSGGFVPPHFVRSFFQNGTQLVMDKLFIAYDPTNPAHADYPDSIIGAAAFVIDDGITQVALVSVDILAIKKIDVDIVAGEIETQLGIPASNILINATHTHAVTSTFDVHGSGDNPVFMTAVRSAIFRAVELAQKEVIFNKANNRKVELHFKEMPFGSIPANGLSILEFKPLYPEGKTELLFSYPAHNTGQRRNGSNVSPGFFGIIAQEYEYILDGKEINEPLSNNHPIAVYFSGTVGGSYYPFGTPPKEIGDTDGFGESIEAFKTAITTTRELNSPSLITNPVISSEKNIFNYKIRDLDPGVPTGEGRIEAIQKQMYEDAISGNFDNEYRDYLHEQADHYLGCAFHPEPNSNPPTLKQTKEGQNRPTWLQNISIGDFNLIGLPGEMYPQYGSKIKEQLANTIVLALTNDHIGYIPYGIDMYSYTAVTAAHSFAEYDTGNNMISALGLAPLASDGMQEGSLNGKPQEGGFVLNTTTSATGWATYWDEIIPVDYNGDGKTELLFWNRVAETNEHSAALVNISSNGTVSVISLLDNWVPRDKIIPLDYNSDNKTDLLFWDQIPNSNTVSHAWLYEINNDGSLTLKKSYILSHWDDIIPLDYNGDGKSELLFWNKQLGSARLVSYTINGQEIPIKDYSGWSTHWDEILPLDYTDDNKTDLLFWNKDTGDSYSMQFSATGNIDHYNKRSVSWPTQFDSISAWSYDSDTKDEIMLFDKETGWTWVLKDNSTNSLTQNFYGSFSLVRETKNDESKWDRIIRLYDQNQPYYLYWDRDTGSAEFRRYVSQ